MPDPCEYIVERITCIERTVHGMVASVEEYIDLANSFTMSSYARMYEHAGAAVTTSTKIKLYPYVRERVTVSEALGLKFKIPTMAESVVCVSVFAQTRTFSIAEAVGAAPVFSSSSTLKYRWRDSVTATARFGTGFHKAVAESVTAAGAFGYQKVVSASVEEAVEAAQVYPDSYTRVAYAIHETVNAAETKTVSAVMQARVNELVRAAQSYWYRDATQIAWQMNTETTAVNWHTNYAFDSIAQFGNTVLATSPDGVYLLSGDDDAAVAIPATVQTGFMDFDDRKVKRMDGVYFGLQGSDLKLSLEIFGGAGPSTYTMPAKTTISPGSNRIIPGKGLLSRYWRMTFENVDGGDFDIDNIELDVVSSKTRRM